METKTAEDIYLDLLRIDSHAKQIKEIMPESGVMIAIDFEDKDSLIKVFKKNDIEVDEYDYPTEAKFQNIHVNIF